MAYREFYVLAPCACGHSDTRSWPFPPSDPSCRECGATLALETRVENYVAHVPYTANKRFQPHFSRSFGVKVEDSYHFKHLQMIHGTEDAPTERVRDGEAPSCVPRSFERDAREAVAKAASVEAECYTDTDDSLPTDFVTDLREDVA